MNYTFYGHTLYETSIPKNVESLFFCDEFNNIIDILESKTEIKYF